jgi:hypothetical protein
LIKLKDIDDLIKSKKYYWSPYFRGA